MEEDEWWEDEGKSMKEENMGSSIYLIPQVIMESEDELMFSFHIPKKRKMECEEDGEMSHGREECGHLQPSPFPLKKRRMECGGRWRGEQHAEGESVLLQLFLSIKSASRKVRSPHCFCVVVLSLNHFFLSWKILACSKLLFT